MILVEHDADGRVKVGQTGDHSVARVSAGAAASASWWSLRSALLASIAVGAAAGGLIGRFAKHRVESGMETGLGDKLAPGTAAIVAMIDDDDRLAAERALAGTPAKSVAQMDKKGVRGLKDALAEAAQQVRARPHRAADPRHELRRDGRPHAARLGRRLVDHPGPKAPEGAPNVLSCSSTTPASAPRTRSAGRSARPP